MEPSLQVCEAKMVKWPDMASVYSNMGSIYVSIKKYYLKQDVFNVVTKVTQVNSVASFYYNTIELSLAFI